MPWMENYDPAALRRETEKAMSLPIGLVSPLWLAFGAAASAGVAWWWMSRLARPFNLEANLGKSRTSGSMKAPAPAVPSEVGVTPTVAPLKTEVEGAEVEMAEDDFTRLVGIGPRIASALVDRGVTRFSQLAAWTEAELAAFDAELNLRGRGHRGDWIGQAKALTLPA